MGIEFCTLDHLVNMSRKSFLDGKRVLVTGHTGFKGSWFLMMLLKLKAQVTGYSLEVSNSSNLFPSIHPSILSKFEHNIGNVLDRNSLSACVSKCDPQFVFHFAAQPLVIESYINPVSTWETNVIGTLNLLESLRCIDGTCVVIIITTDKVYSNQECSYGYRENDRLGGFDPYSSSKAAVELAVDSWRSSFCSGQQSSCSNLLIATARSGNVIGGGDWSSNRIIPDAIRALMRYQPIVVRNPESVRPWLHVIEPLHGYIMLSKYLFFSDKPDCGAFNFGPLSGANRSVKNLVQEVFKTWPGSYSLAPISSDLHETSLLTLNVEKTASLIGWRSVWDFENTVSATVSWYRDVLSGHDSYDRSMVDINNYFYSLTSL